MFTENLDAFFSDFGLDVVVEFSVQSLASIAVVSAIATATREDHGYLTGQSIVIAGATPSGLNGAKVITVLDADTFTWAATGVSDGTATGTITAQRAPIEMLGLLDMPDATLGGLGQSTEYLLTMKTSDLSPFDEGQMVSIDGTQYALRGPSFKVDDGKFSRVELTKL